MQPSLIPNVTTLLPSLELEDLDLPNVFLTLDLLSLQLVTLLTLPSVLTLELLAQELL